nr:hypothetical protein BaRGS_018206 [Batillaria attramentaria]
MSMLDAPEQVSDELRNRAATLINHVTTVCPVTIQIDECSDDESRDFNKSTENGDLPPSDDIKDRLTSERKERINDALDWLKTELGSRAPSRTQDSNEICSHEKQTLRNNNHRFCAEL